MAEGEGAGRADLPPHRAPDAQQDAAHRLRGGELPQHRRVLGARHRHVHDPGRHLHAPVRLLQREVRRARGGRPRRAAARGPCGGPDGAAPLRRDVGRPRRPARPRRGRVRGHDPRDPPPRARLRRRGADAGLPRPGDAARARDRRAPGRVQPQRRDGAAALPEGAPRIGLHALVQGAPEREAHGSGRRHEVGPDGRAGRVDGRDAGGVRAAARARRAGPHRGPVPAPVRAAPAGGPLLDTGGVRPHGARGVCAGLRVGRLRPARAQLLPRRRAGPRAPRRYELAAQAAIPDVLDHGVADAGPLAVVEQVRRTVDEAPAAEVQRCVAQHAVAGAACLGLQKLAEARVAGRPDGLHARGAVHVRDRREGIRRHVREEQHVRVVAVVVEPPPLLLEQAGGRDRAVVLALLDVVEQILRLRRAEETRAASGARARAGRSRRGPGPRPPRRRR